MDFVRPVFCLKWVFLVILGLFELAHHAAAQETVLLEEPFAGGLRPGWVWRRENPRSWRFADRGLEIDVEPFADAEAKNVLVRPADFRGRGIFQIETKVTFLDPPSNQYQQGGIYWMQSGRVVFKLVHEYMDGGFYIFPGKVPVNANSVKLRLISSGDDVFAEFCGENESSFRRIYEGKLEKSDSDEVGIQCWHGPNTSGDGARIRFESFRITKVGE